MYLFFVIIDNANAGITETAPYKNILKNLYMYKPFIPQPLCKKPAITFSPFLDD